MVENVKALVLFSGGLDSLLAVRVLEKQGIKVYTVCFYSNFFDGESVKKTAEANDMEVTHMVDISQELLDLVKDPEAKKGKNLNPCIDCHGLMVEKAKEILSSQGYDLLATGEVLGQRPFSQTKEAMKEVEKKGDIEILRPLSAQELEPTSMEKEGMVDREKLLNIQGRGRKKQIYWAVYYNVKNYKSPAGGCLLTEAGFSRKISLMLKFFPEVDVEDIELLKHGRVEWFSILDEKGGTHYILAVTGRKELDNVNLYYSQKKGDIVVNLKNIRGPLTLLRSKDHDFHSTKATYSLDIPELFNIEEHKQREYTAEEDLFKDVALMTAWYKTSVRGKKAEVEVKKG